MLFDENYHTHKQKKQAASKKYYTQNKEKYKNLTKISTTKDYIIMRLPKINIF